MRPKGKKLEKRRQRSELQEIKLRAVRQYWAWQDMRISVNSQLGAMVRQGLLTQEECDGCAKEWTAPFVAAEKECAKKMVQWLESEPVYTQWLQHVRGVGKILAAQILAISTPITDFPTVSAFWAYCGYHVKDGKAARREHGVVANWSNEAKTTFFNLGACFVKAGGPYRELYDRYKARDRAAHPEKGKAGGKYSDGHMHTRAMRYAVKIFMSHLWSVSYDLAGIPCRQPFVHEKLGHETYISPWSMIEREPRVVSDDTEEVPELAVAV